MKSENDPTGFVLQPEASGVGTNSRPKVVYVRAYDRFRFGRTEHVCSHYRSRPHQYTFGF